MKKLHWKRIINDPDAVTKTVWSDISQRKVNIKEIESLFAQKTNSAPKFD